MNFPQTQARPLHCTCCGRPFARTSRRGPAPRYCSFDCRAQMRVRARVWSGHAKRGAVSPTERIVQPGAMPPGCAARLDL